MKREEMRARFNKNWEEKKEKFEKMTTEEMRNKIIEDFKNNKKHEEKRIKEEKNTMFNTKADWEKEDAKKRMEEHWEKMKIWEKATEIITEITENWTREDFMRHFMENRMGGTIRSKMKEHGMTDSEIEKIRHHI